MLHESLTASSHNVYRLPDRPAVVPKPAVETDVGFDKLKALDRAYSLLVDAESALLNASVDKTESDQVYAVGEKVRDRMRRALLSPAFVDDPITRFSALKRAAGIDGVVSPLTIHTARAFADSAERALGRERGLRTWAGRRRSPDNLLQLAGDADPSRTRREEEAPRVEETST